MPSRSLTKSVTERAVMKPANPARRIIAITPNGIATLRQNSDSNLALSMLFSRR